MCNNVQYFAGYKFVTRSNLDTLPCGILVKKPIGRGPPASLIL